MNRFSIVAQVILSLLIFAGCGVLCKAASSTVVIDFVTVGNPGNGDDPVTHSGAVSYIYRIGKYEVTNGQYAEFLNAIATTDTFSYYDLNMAQYGITRHGSPGTYSYTVNPGFEQLPVNFVSTVEARGFCNWLHHGQPVGIQDATTTEDGAYTINSGGTFHYNVGARYWFPTEDEWYKAAYHKNDGVTSNYWAYATGSNTFPSNQLINPDPGNNANFRIGNTYTAGPPIWLTNVGEFENSESAYGTFDQNGNLFEWTNTIWEGASRYAVFQGGAFINPLEFAQGQRGQRSFVTKSEVIGFRLAAPFLPGDYNSNGVVDAADYVVWRKSLGQTGSGLVADGDNDGTVDLDDFDVWRANFGAAAGDIGSSAAILLSVPEPSSILLAEMLGLAFLIVDRKDSRVPLAQIQSKFRSVGITGESTQLTTSQPFKQRNSQLFRSLSDW